VKVSEQNFEKQKSVEQKNCLFGIVDVYFSNDKRRTAKISVAMKKTKHLRGTSVQNVVM